MIFREIFRDVRNIIQSVAVMRNMDYYPPTPTMCVCISTPNDAKKQGDNLLSTNTNNKCV